MLDNFPQLQKFIGLAGRVLLGLYFFGPGVQKLFAWEAMQQYMTTHGVPLVGVLLVLTVIIQVGGGLSLMLGFRAGLVALVLAGLTLLINLFMHDFWNVYEGLDQGHELQNFVKNLGIMAGLLFVAGSQTPRAAPG